MRAAVCRRYGAPDGIEIEERPEPQPGPGEVLVDVHAAGVNFPDLLILQDRYQMRAELPFVPGSEFAGVVRALGPGVEQPEPGEPVCGAMFVGAFAEQVVVRAEALTRLPRGVDLTEAAVFGVAHGTAWSALRCTARLARGETLVVLGAAGGVGLAAVELGKLLGARVIAAASSPEKLEACREAGADELVDYNREDLKRRLMELTARRGADVVIDPVGGEVAEPALRATGWRGRYVVVGFASGEIPRVPLNLPLLKGCEIHGFAMGPMAMNAPQEMAEARRELFELFATGKVRPRISAVHPLERVARALAEVGERRVRGKVAIEMHGSGPPGPLAQEDRR